MSITIIIIAIFPSRETVVSKERTLSDEIIILHRSRTVRTTGGRETTIPREQELIEDDVTVMIIIIYIVITIIIRRYYCTLVNSNPVAKMFRFIILIYICSRLSAIPIWDQIPTGHRIHPPKQYKVD